MGTRLMHSRNPERPIHRSDRTPRILAGSRPYAGQSFQRRGTLVRDLATNSPLDYYGFEAARLLKSMKVAPNREKKSEQSFPEIRLTPAESSNSLISTALKLMEMAWTDFFDQSRSAPQVCEIVSCRGFSDRPSSV